MPNLETPTGAQTTEITGVGGRGNGLACKERASGKAHRVALEGVLVQIGLVLHTEWLRGTVELSVFDHLMRSPTMQVGRARAPRTRQLVPRCGGPGHFFPD